MKKSILKSLATAATLLAVTATGVTQSVELLNVSYDPTREFYIEFNNAFAKHWKEKQGRMLKSINPTADPASKPDL